MRISVTVHVGAPLADRNARGTSATTLATESGANSQAGGRLTPWARRLPPRLFPPVIWLFDLLTWRGGMEPAHPANRAAGSANDASAIERNRLRRSMMVGFILHLSALWLAAKTASGAHDVDAGTNQRKRAGISRRCEGWTLSPGGGAIGSPSAMRSRIDLPRSSGSPRQMATVTTRRSPYRAAARPGRMNPWRPSPRS